MPPVSSVVGLVPINTTRGLTTCQKLEFHGMQDSACTRGTKLLGYAAEFVPFVVPRASRVLRSLIVKAARSE